MPTLPVNVLQTHFSPVTRPLWHKRWALAMALLLAGIFAPQEGIGAEAGPLAHQFPLTLDLGRRFEAAGPFYFEQERRAETSYGVPPLFSVAEDSDVDSREFDILYPFLTYDRYGPEFRWQVLQLFNVTGGHRLRDDSKVERTTVFPLYFQQRSENPAEDYTALVPFYGTLRNRLLRDEIHFVLFPLYSQTKRHINPSRVQITTDNYLYPFFHVRSGEGLRGWQFWPFYSVEEKAVTLRTNEWNEVVVGAGHHGRFVLWPLFLKATRGIGTDNPEQFTASLPLFSVERSPARDTTIVLWPFFIHTEDRERNYREWDLPWPFVVLARPTGEPTSSPTVLRRWPASRFGGGAGKTVTRVFPLFSQSYTQTQLSEFYAWPLFKRNRTHAPPLDRDRWRLLLFLYSALTEKNLDAGTAVRRQDFWPLFTHRTDHQGRERLQVLAPLEPILPGNKAIERNWSPLWSLWRAESDAESGRASQSLLWNLYRRDTAPGSRKCSLLFGLFQYQSDAEGARRRWFHLFETPAAPPAAGSH